MKKLSFALAVLLLFSAALFAQPHQDGSVEGLVTDTAGVPVPGAMIMLAGVDGGHHGPHGMARVNSGPDGTFAIRFIPAGPYTITAMHPQVGFAAELIEVVPNQTTNVTLVLRPHGGDGEHHDSLTVVELEGTAIVVQPSDSSDRMVRYFLDVDGDAIPDYELAFGPPWYNPPNGNTRPENGDEITVVGGLLTHNDPPVVVVFQLNGEFWRDPRHDGHGGFGGGDHWRHGCDPDSLTAVDLAGTAIVRGGEGFHGEFMRYFLNTDDDSMPEYVLDFGGPDYVPPSEAERPNNGDEITIVGGQLFCPNQPPDAPPIVIVYEINGLLWRVPGDTAGLGPMPLSVSEPISIGTALSYITAHNYPNPFNPSTTINYSIPVAGDVRVAVYDITGREVANLVNVNQNAGSYAVFFDGSSMASGIYFYRVSVGNLNFTNRMVLMK